MKRLITISILIYIINPFNIIYSQDNSYLNWSTFLGVGMHKQAGFKIDSTGNSFITGVTNTSDFPITTGAYQYSLKGGGDIFVSKLNFTGAHLIFSTFIGGPGTDISYDLSIDKFGNTYITGTCDSNFPTSNYSYKITGGSGDNSFVTKLNTTGTELIYSTYIGNGILSAIIIDKNLNSIVTGIVWNNGFPVTTGAYDTIFHGGDDGILTKLNSSGTDLIFSTFIGGSSDDQSWYLIKDSVGNLLISGGTSSINFPTTIDAYQKSLNGRTDVYLSKIDSSGSSMIFSTLIGGNDHDWGGSLGVGSNSEIYLSGSSKSNNFPITPGCYDSSYNGGDGDIFISKMNSTASSLVYSTFIGGSNNEWASSLVLDKNNYAYITGITWSDNYPFTKDAFDSSYSGFMDDAIISVINSDGSNLLYSSYLGGSEGRDQGRVIALDSLNNIYITGNTSSSDFPVTSGAFNITYRSYWDVFVSKFGICNGKPNIQSLNSIIFKPFCLFKAQDTTFIIRNSGACTMRLIGMNLSGSDSLDFTIIEPKKLPIYMSPDDSIKITIRFSPSTKAVSKFANLNISNNTLKNPYLINLSAKMGVPVIQTVNQINYPYMFCSAFKQDTTLMIYNKGACTLSLDSSTFFGSDSSQFSITKPNHFPIVIESNDFAKITIRFTPNKVTGKKTASLTISNNTSINPYIINLSANNDSIAYNVNNKVSDTIIIYLGNICPGSTPKDTTITIFNKSSIGTTFKIENKDPQLQITPEGKAGKKEEDEPQGLKKK
jgi:hypothetical protein